MCTGYLQKTLDHAKDEINQEIEERLDKQKYLASERAIAKMDKHSRQEVSDNDWLKKEVRRLQCITWRLFVYF